MSNNNNLMPVRLPSLKKHDTEPLVKDVTNCLEFTRNTLASSRDIQQVWSNLPVELENIKEEYRHELLARMVIAIRVGLFSTAVNEIWNTSMIAVRKKINSFGLYEAGSLLNLDLAPNKFKELTDKDLLDISVKLGFFNEDSYFFLDGCRQIRNNYSSAHPSNSMLDGVELNYVIHQCVKHILSSDLSFVGLNMGEYINAIKFNELDSDSKDILIQQFLETNQLQQSALMKSIFGIYVSPDNENISQQARDNALSISEGIWDELSEEIIAELLSMYSTYLIKNNSTQKQYAKRFFEKMHSLDILPENERYSIIHGAIQDLLLAHDGIDNFYLEKPFAERIYNLYNQIPDSLKKTYVNAISICYVGNSYGTAYSATNYYEKMISNFNVKEVNLLFELVSDPNSQLSRNIKQYRRCKSQFKSLLELISETTIPVQWKTLYYSFLK